MVMVDIEETIYKEISALIDKRKEKEPYKTFTIKEFVNIAIKDKISMDKLGGA